MGSLLAVLLGVALTLNGLLWRTFSGRSRDEIGKLAHALSRMRRSLVQAMSMLET
ncbi:MAG TPA: hypothetical protein VFZ28_08930 [Burkholderiaceae bacterium]|nr:hypothetical protein [Burkholderiaceae bacterium]